MYYWLLVVSLAKKVSLKVSKDETVFIWRGRLFHTRGAATEHILSLYRLLNGGTSRSLLLAERSSHAGRLAVYHACDVGWCEPVLSTERQEQNFVCDPLLHRKPVKFL